MQDNAPCVWNKGSDGLVCCLEVLFESWSTGSTGCAEVHLLARKSQLGALCSWGSRRCIFSAVERSIAHERSWFVATVGY